jgi:hypothetical protein
LHIESSVQFTDERYVIICQFNSSGKYYVQYLYVVINNRGVCHAYTPVMWRLNVPSIIHILWLLANNKTLTRDNLAKRKKVEDMTCVFYSELESLRHLFF